LALLDLLGFPEFFLSQPLSHLDRGPGRRRLAQPHAGEDLQATCCRFKGTVTAQIRQPSPDPGGAAVPIQLQAEVQRDHALAAAGTVIVAACEAEFAVLGDHEPVARAKEARRSRAGRAVRAVVGVALLLLNPEALQLLPQLAFHLRQRLLHFGEGAGAVGARWKPFGDQLTG
jgi:hypothetical protein